MPELPQRRLAYELRIAIDRAMRSPQPRHINKLLHLLAANPRGVQSSHVQHNLGVARRAYVAQLVPTQTDRSFVESLGDLEGIATIVHKEE